MRIAPTIACHTRVSAYLDGRASGIQTHVLDGVDQFERAVKRDPGLSVCVEGQRNSRGWRTALAGATMAATVALGAAATLAGAPALVGFGIAAALTATVALPVATLARQDFEARNWSGKQSYEINSGRGEAHSAQDTPSDRLAGMLEKGGQASRHVAYFSGHGTQTRIVDISTDEVAEALRGHQLDLSVFDVCLAGQLEVVSKVAPWAGIAILSSRPVPGKGFPIEKLFAPEQLKTPDNRELGKAMATLAAPSVKSLCAVDTVALHAGGGFDALDRLGRALKSELENGSRKAVIKALRSSRSPQLFSSKVDLVSFLRATEASSLKPATRQAAVTALQHLEEATIYQNGKLGLSFDLKAEKLPKSLSGWQDFISTMRLGSKPMSWWPAPA